MTIDPFSTAGLRRAVLDAWAASPARFREDANAEEALATGGYAGRLLIELAANAVDAAREVGLPGRVRFTFDDSGEVPELRAANVGAVLTAAGVSGLASLRASAKRGRAATVGHFGVGFTAVMAVTDVPAVLSRSGGVRFSRSGTAEAIAALSVAELNREVTARRGQVPALRLPWPVEHSVLQADPIPDGFDTQVRLPLREGIEPVLAELLAGVGDDLLWALPGLMTMEIELPDRRPRVISRQDLDDGITLIHCGGAVTRYRTASRRGTIPAELLANRPIEERDRDEWQLTWVLPAPEEQPSATLGFETDAPADPVFLGAPTPTDEPLSLPARLVGTFPVDDTRRRLAAGPLTEYLLGQAADGYADLFTSVPSGDRLALVPAAGFPLGPVDAVLREGVVRRLARSPVLVTALGEPTYPAAACVINGVSDAAAVLLGRAIPGLLPPPRSPADSEAMRTLGVATVPLAEATTALAGIDGPPAFWREVYQAVSDQQAEDLADLPIPLAGGGRRIGPAGCLLPGVDAVDVEVLNRAARLAPDLRIVHPEAVHPLLARLGGVPADAAALLGDPALILLYHDFREDLEDSDPDFDDLRDLARLALDLVSGAGGVVSGLLADVVLTDADGQAWPASELLAPGAPLASVLAADADLPLIGGEWAGYSERALAGIGVRTGLKVVQVDHADADLPDLQDWWSEVVGDDLPPEEFLAIADLDLIDDQKWPQLLQMIAADQEALRTLTSGPDPSYTRWWLRHFALVDDQPVHHWRLPAAVDLAGLYDELPVPLDPTVATAVGVLGAGTDAVQSDPAELVNRLADPDRSVAAGLVPGLTRLAAQALEADPEMDLPRSIRTLSGAVIDADHAMVLDLPWLAQVVDAGSLVAGGADPRRIAGLFDLDIASTATEFAVVGARAGELSPDQVVAAERACLSVGSVYATLFPAGSLRTAPGLSVRAGTGASVRVAWWAASDSPASGVGALVTDGSAEGIGRAIAWKSGRWADREMAAAAARGDLVVFAENGLG